jgi:hypothetical protein
MSQSIQAISAKLLLSLYDFLMKSVNNIVVLSFHYEEYSSHDWVVDGGMIIVCNSEPLIRYLILRAQPTDYSSDR